MAESDNEAPQTNIATLAREVEEFVASAGWDQRPQLFGLVPTDALLREQPELAAQLDVGAPLTPVAQEELPEGELDEALAQIAWPDAVHGCALAQEIIVLPPGAEGQLPGHENQRGDSEQDSPDTKRLRQAAADHPQRTEARLVAAVLRGGGASCVLRLRGEHRSDGVDVDELIEHPELAPNLIDALKTTLLP